jgi:hypothetical protein
MSADNFYLIRVHPDGGFAAVMGFASENDMPEATSNLERFIELEDALVWAADEYTEYGVDIHPECFGGIIDSMPVKSFTEPGQWLFSNTDVQEFEAYWASSQLETLANVIAEARGQEHDDLGYSELITSGYDTDFYENDVFAIRPYCWCDQTVKEHYPYCPPNFEHKPSGLTISWYKNAHRGITANQTFPGAKTWWSVINECVESISPPESLTDVRESLRERLSPRFVEDGFCGFAPPNGWLSLVEEIDATLQVNPNYRIAQVKEKFGGLRFYVEGITTKNEAQYIADMEYKSFSICQQCGCEDDTVARVNSGWIRTLCEKCGAL